MCNPPGRPFVPPMVGKTVAHINQGLQPASVLTIMWRCNLMLLLLAPVGLRLDIQSCGKIWGRVLRQAPHNQLPNPYMPNMSAPEAVALAVTREAPQLALR